jgi:hypothetical protein
MTNERELLRRALVYLSGLPARTYIQDDIEAYLSTEPEAEPVAWIQPNHLEKAQFMPHLCRVEPKQRANFVPLYLHPPKPAEPAERKPMTPKECSDGYMELEGVLGPDAHLISFLSGICVAQKHHGIGGDDA